MDEILRVKEELAESYIKEFKKELGFLKWWIFSMFEKKVKWLLLSEDDLWDNIDSIWLNFFEKLIVSISPSTAEKIFKFIKEKQEKLQKAKTSWELNDLKNDVVSDNNEWDEVSWINNEWEAAWWTNNEWDDAWWNNTNTNTEKDNKSINSVAWWAIAGGAWWAVILGIDKYWKNVDINKIKKLHPEVDNKTTKELFEKMKWDFDDLSKNLEKQASNPKITKLMRKNILKSSKEFEKASKELDKWWIEAFDAWRKLWNKLPDSIIKSISPKESKLLLWLGDDVLDQIKNMDDIADIQKLLKSKWISWIWDETLKVLKSTTNLWEMKLMVNCLSRATTLRNVLRSVKSVALLDVIFLWVDVWMYLDTKEEAELLEKVNFLRADAMKNKAMVQFWLGWVGTAILSIGTTILVSYITAWTAVGTVVPWIGNAIWFIAWALVAWTSILVTNIIEKQHEKRDAYLKNEEDYKREYRSEIKQSILQVIAAKEWNFNSSLRNKIEKQRWNDIQTVQDWLRALIWLEEYDNSEYYLLQKWYESGLSQEEFCKNLDAQNLDLYNKQVEIINKKIDIRMEYIKKYMYQNKSSKEYQKFINDIETGKWISALEQILAESELYANMKDDSKDQYVLWCSDIQDYKKKYWEKLKSENNQLFDIFEEKIKDNVQLSWIHSWVVSYEYVLDQNKNDPEIAWNYDSFKKNADFIKKYYVYKTLWLSYEEKNSFKLSYSDFDYNYIESLLKDPSKIDNTVIYNTEQIKNYFDSWELDNKLESYTEVSDSLWQNIIYRIAKEIHWYKWSNDQVLLMWFFSEEKKNNLWIYYDYQWRINVHKTRILTNDVSFKLSDFDTQSWYDRILKYFWDSYENFDSVLDHVDEQININYKDKINEIMKEEKSYKNPEVKKQIENEVLNYIKQNSSNISESYPSVVWYLDIPYHMQIKAQKAGIWNLQKFMFKYVDGKFFAISTWNYITDTLNFDQTKTILNREYMKKLRNNLSSEEMQYVNYVGSAYQKLEQLRSIKWSWTKEDELDIPIEYERSISQMAKKRKDFKESLLYLDPVIVEEKLNDNYMLFHDYFESMYMWLLSVVDKNKISNDIDDVNYMSQAYNRLGRDIVSFDSKTNKISVTKWLLREWSEEKFHELINEKLYENKSLIEIFKEDEDKWKWLAKQIIKSILESVVVDIDDKWNISDINNWYFNYIDEKKLEKSLSINLSKNKYFKWVDYNSSNITVNQKSVNSLDEDSDKVWSKVWDITEKIEKTLPNVDRSGKRWNIKFDMENNTIISRDNNVNIEIIWEKIKIKWLNIEFDIYQWICVANLINRFKYKYPNTHDFYFGSRLWSGMDYGIYKSENWVDTQIIDLDTIKEKFPSIIDKNNDVGSEFMKYINSI